MIFFMVMLHLIPAGPVYLRHSKFHNMSSQTLQEIKHAGAALGYPRKHSHLRKAYGFPTYNDIVSVRYLEVHSQAKR